MMRRGADEAMRSGGGEGPLARRHHTHTTTSEHHGVVTHHPDPSRVLYIFILKSQSRHRRVLE